MAKDKSEMRKMLILVVTTLFYIAFIITNLSTEDISYRWGIISLVLSIVSFVFLLGFGNLKKYAKKPSRKLWLLQKDWVLDLIIGIIVGGAIYFVMILVPTFSLAVPTTPQSLIFPEPFSVVGQVLTSVISAPLVEEVFFRTALFGLLFVIIGFGFWTSTILSSLGFAFYHIYAYAGEISLSAIISVQTDFFVAFVVGVLICIANYYRGSVSTGMGIHGTLNGLLTFLSVVEF